MSYCRKGPESDVYLYPTTDERDPTWEVICDGCPLCGTQDDDDPINVALHSPQALLRHIAAHQLAGHKVPIAAIVRAMREARK